MDYRAINNDAGVTVDTAASIAGDGDAACTGGLHQPIGHVNAVVVVAGACRRASSRDSDCATDGAHGPGCTVADDYAFIACASGPSHAIKRDGRAPARIQRLYEAAVLEDDAVVGPSRGRTAASRRQLN